MKFIKSILCVIEPDHCDTETLTRALKLAEGQQSALKVVTVVEHVNRCSTALLPGLSSAEIQQSLLENAKRRLQRCVASLHCWQHLETEVMIGVPFLEIIREVEKNGHDLVIKAAESNDFIERMLGSEDKHLLRKCPCPVLMLKPGVASEFRHILAAVDISDKYPDNELTVRQELNRRTLQLATTLALSEFAQLSVIYAWHTEGESLLDSGFGRISDDEINDHLADVQRRYEDAMDALMHDVFHHLKKEAFDFLKPQRFLVKGNPRREIPNQAELLNSDVVVMGTVARTGIPGFIIGNTAETILDRLDHSVLALKPAGFESPVRLNKGDD